MWVFFVIGGKNWPGPVVLVCMAVGNEGEREEFRIVSMTLSEPFVNYGSRITSNQHSKV